MRLIEQEARLFVGNLSDIDAADPEQIESAGYDSSNYFQGYLQRAIAEANSENHRVDMETPSGVITALPNSRHILVALTENQLRSLSRVPLLHDITLNQGDVGSDTRGAKKSSVNVDSLLWRVALWGARGRFPVGTDLAAPIYLKHWPNMTRLTIFPYAMRIAALWVNQPYSLLETAKMLGIPQRYVFSFYSATNALGLAAVSQRSVDRLVLPQAAQQHKEHSLFGRILATLRR
jgi:hypothetical protein